LLNKKKYEEVRKVFSWPGACDEPGTIQVLLKAGAQVLATEYLDKSTIGIKASDLEQAFNSELWEICIKMLKFKEAVTALYSPRV
jgi:hypothetical protein